MTTYSDYKVGGTTGFAESKITAKLIQATINFATQNAVEGDRFDLFTLPVGSFVLFAGSQTKTVCAGTGTLTSAAMELTDGTKQWVAAGNLLSAGYHTLLASQTTAPETLATSAQTIYAVVDVTGGGTLTSGEYHAWAIVIDVAPKAAATTAVL